MSLPAPDRDQLLQQLHALLDGRSQGGDGSPELHVLSEPLGVGRLRSGLWTVRCSCGFVWGGYRLMDAPAVCPVAEASADLIADLARLIDDYLATRRRLGYRSRLEEAQLHGATAG